MHRPVEPAGATESPAAGRTDFRPRANDLPPQPPGEVRILDVTSTLIGIVAGGAVAWVIHAARSKSGYTDDLRIRITSRGIQPKKGRLLFPGKATFVNELDAEAEVLFGKGGPFKRRNGDIDRGHFKVPGGIQDAELEADKDPGPFSRLFPARWQFEVTAGGQKIDPGIMIREG